MQVRPVEGHTGTAVLFHRRITVERCGATLLVAAAIGVMSAAGFADTASAENFFDMLFSGMHQRAAPQQTPPPANAYSDVTGTASPPGERFTGSDRAFCVRLCDGRYFPVQRHHAATPAQLCTAFCPASRTRVFYGGDIERASAPGGARYAELDNAFVYRKQLVKGCTCNGQDAFGLARIDVGSDPTLQPGDVVATPSGLMAFSAGRPRRGAVQTGEFTPVPTIGGPSTERRKVAAENPSLANRAAD